MTRTVVIAGAGHAAGQAVATLRQLSFPDRIVLVGEEPYLPYQRPPLSKKYLAGELPAERLYVKPASFYDVPQIERRLETRIEHIDRDVRSVVTGGGEAIAYDKLVIATGSRVRKISVPGSDLDGIHYLRSISDVDGIRAAAVPGARIVIVGAGYIGLEVAAVCRRLGFDVTVLELAERVMSRVVSEPVSDFFAALHERHGVSLRLATGLAAFDGNGRVAAVVTEQGDSIPADLVVVGIGIVPNSELAAVAGLTCDDGIVVDEYCRTGDADVYAIGDCTRHPSAIYDRPLRLESVHNALEQARTAASHICGHPVAYSQVPWFWSDQYDVKLQIAGISAGYDDAVIRGDPSASRFACFYLSGGVLIAVDAINSPREFVQSKPLIEQGASIPPEQLADPDAALRDLA